MKKAIYITLIFGILISCSENKTISEIKNYVNKIDNRTDLNESITEFNTENLNGEIVGGTSIYALTDKDNKLYRIIKESSQPNDSVFNYEFYYKDKKLIFTKVINPIAYHKKSFGTKGGFLSNDIIGFDELMYNRKNWRDVSKVKGETRQEYELRAKNLIKKRKLAYSKFTMQQAKNLIAKRYNKVSEVQDELAVGDATQVHHIFPRNEFPIIESYVENLILLTATQHSTKAHPDNNTRRINKAYQYVCIQSKCDTIQESVETIKDGFYSKQDFSFVLNRGINTENFNENLSFDEIRNKLTEFYHN